jgi:hypothetical protein
MLTLVAIVVVFGVVPSILIVVVFEAIATRERRAWTDEQGAPRQLNAKIVARGRPVHSRSA